MGKYVYLFELDSVRKTDEEIAKAQEALCDEIVGNGNTVVMTYNQIVDSRGFFYLLNNKEYYDSIVKLFKKGKIKVSQYGDIRTLSQYFIDSIERESGFIYSALPVKNNQKRLLALIRRSLMYSDLSEIYGYGVNGFRNKEELRDIFIEIKTIKDKDDTIQIEEESTLSDEEMREILNNLYWMLSYILKLSRMHEIYLPPKEEKEYQNLKMYNFINIVLDFSISNDLWNIELWNGAKSVIESLENYDKNSSKRDDRSKYLIELKNKWNSQNSKGIPIESFKLAESIINQCYNYACEISICNISKHYDVEELLKETNEKPSFKADFFIRLRENWEDGDPLNKRFLMDETNEFDRFDVGLEKYLKDLMVKAVRLINYPKETESQPLSKVYKYEHNFKQQRNDNKRKIRAGIRRRIWMLFAYIFFMVIFSVIIDYILGVIIDPFVTNPFLSSLIALILMLPTELLSSWLQKRNPRVISLSEAIGDIFVIIKDRLRPLELHSIIHVNQFNCRIDEEETVSNNVPIDYVKTIELKRYIALRKECNKTNSSLFSNSDIYSLIDVNNDSAVKKVLRNEEIYNRKYGVIYQSKFNKLLVDPVENNGECIPYERIMPASGHDGVVVIAKCNDRFILLNQFRHALRQNQYSFPRGFAESQNPEDDVIRELEQELNAKIKGKLREIGRIVPDSGLTTTRAYVYCIDIDSYSANEGHEGIVNSVEVPCNEIEQWIKDNKIDDGYTLGAYILLKSKMSVVENNSSDEQL